MWTRSSFRSTKGERGPVFAQPKVDPIQFSLSQSWPGPVLLSQKWTQSSFFAKPKVGPVYFCSAKSEPGPIFAQSKADPVWVEFYGTRVGPIVNWLGTNWGIGSTRNTGHLTRYSILRYSSPYRRWMSYVYVCIHSSTTANDADKLLAAFYLCCLSITTLFVAYYIHTGQTVAIRLPTQAFVCAFCTAVGEFPVYGMYNCTSTFSKAQ